MVVKEAQQLAFRRLMDVKYFRISDVNGQYVACRRTDPDAYVVNLKMLEQHDQDYTFLKIDLVDMELAVNNRKATVDKTETKQLEDFYRKFAIKA